MRAVFVAGVLGVGTALVFGAAALTATLFPNGTMVNAGWNGAWGGKGIAVPMPAPMVMPAGPGPFTIVDDSGGGVAPPTDLPQPDVPMPTD